MDHLLWSDIVADERASTIAERLMSDGMFSGWGVRTTSMGNEACNPIGYHQRNAVGAAVAQQGEQDAAIADLHPVCGHSEDHGDHRDRHH